MRFLARILNAILLILLLAITAIRARPYNNHDLTKTLSTCDTVCLLGIQPGITTTADALAILSQHPWIESVGDEEGFTIFWFWNGNQPSVFKQSQAVVIRTQQETVKDIRVELAIPLGETWLSLGEEPADFFNKPLARCDNNMGFHSIKNNSDTVIVNMLLPCPITRYRLWRGRVFITIVGGGSLSQIADGSSD